jgi:hypothetical protein
VFSFADHHLAIGLDFQHRWPYFGTESRAPLLDPRGGKLTNPEDLPLISPLADLGARTQPANDIRPAVRFGETAVKCFRL